MRSWSPKNTDNGWFPKLHPLGTHVLYGFWESNIADVATGAETRLVSRSGVRLQPLGWLDAETCMFGTEGIPATIYKVPLNTIPFDPAGRMQMVIPASCAVDMDANDAAFNWGNARAGQWGLGYAQRTYNIKNGTPFRKDQTQYGVYVAGDHLVTSDLSKNYAIQHYVGTNLVRELLPDNKWVCNEQGDIITGYYGTVRVYPWGESLVNATVAPSKAEGIDAPPVRLNGDLWVWTSTEIGVEPNTEMLGLGRRIVLSADGKTRVSEPDPIVLHNNVGAVGDVVVVGNEFVVACYDTKGNIEVRWVPVDAPREKLATTYTIAPLPRPIWTGYVYGMSDQYGDNPSAPGSLQLLTNEPAAVQRAVALGMKVIVPPPCAYLVPTNQLVAVSATGSTVTELEADIVRARAALQTLGLSRPVVGYLDQDDWARLPNPAPDWYNPQAYCKLNETPAQFKARIQLVLKKFPPNATIALMCQAYNTNATLTNNLLEVQYVYPELARDDARVNGIFWFSDGRESPALNVGGTRFNSFIRPAHIATVQASPGVPAIVDAITEDPTATIETYSPMVTEGTGVLAIARVTSGVATRLQWLVRVANSGMPWVEDADNPASDIDHTYRLPVGRWEIALRVQPGGATTGMQRVVTVKAIPPVPPPPPPVPPPVPPTPEPPPEPTPSPAKKLTWWQKILRSLGLL